MRRLLPCLILVWGILLAGPLLGQERARAEFEYEGDEIVLEADRLRRESATLWVAEGEVVLTYRDMVLTTSRLTYNPLTADAATEGGVEVTRGVQWLKATRGELNLRTDTGILHQVQGFTDEELYLQAERLTQTGPGRWVAEDGFLTACREDFPKWSFTVGSAAIQAGGNARLTNTLFKIKKVPVFYLPYALFPTGEKERSSGFMLPSTGNSNNKGRRISQAFYLVLGRSADLLFHEDYFSERGFGHGVTLRTRPNAATSLELDWYTVDDRKNQGGSYFNGVGVTRIHGFRAVADFNLVSSFLFRQVFSDDFYTATLPTDNSRVFLSNHFQNGAFNLLISREETEFPGPNVIIRNTPTLRFSLIGQKLPRLPVYLDLDTSAEGRSRTRLLSTTARPSGDLGETPGITQRLDLFPRLYTSLPLFQGLRLNPSLGFRETFYSDSLNPQADPDMEAPLSASNLNRRYLQLELNLKGWGLSRVYGSGNGGGWKHLFEPTLAYRYITGADELDRTIRFDEQDAVANTNEIEYGLVNRIFVKRRVGSEMLTREWLSFKIVQKHFLDEDFGGNLRPGMLNQFFPLNTLTGFPYAALPRSYSPVTGLLRFTPRNGFSFDLRGDYDPRFSLFRNLSLTGALNRPGLYLGTTYFLTREAPDLKQALARANLPEGTLEGNQLQLQVALGNVAKGLSASTTLSYDIESQRFLTHRTRLNHFWDCCGISVEYQGFNVGVREERQIRFSFFLKGIGNFGTIRRPQQLF